MPRRHAKGDPLEGFNRTMYGLHTRLDRAIFRPVAFGYKTVVPKPVRGGLRHFFSNLTEPIVFLNDLLQLKPKHAIKTFARFLINSTAGIGGLLDLAKDDGLPHRDNGFGNTLARYGVGPGPYLFLPFFGPSTLRDFAGGQADGYVLPVAVGKPFDRLDFQIARGVLDGLDLRVESDSQLKALLDGAADPYATLRSVYLQNRVVEVNELLDRPPPSPLDDTLADPEAKPDDGKAPPKVEPKPDTDMPTSKAAPIEPSPPKEMTLAFVAYSDWRV
ncbi:MAG: VacJ family lipoprotein [Sphingomonas sp.]|nr:VacJ family lipoprotein [Sphingomonas sp.]